MFLTVRASGGQRSTSSVVPWEPNALFFGSGFLTQELAGSAGLASEPQGSAPLCFPRTGFVRTCPCPAIFEPGFWGPHSGPRSSCGQWLFCRWSQSLRESFSTKADSISQQCGSCDIGFSCCHLTAPHPSVRRTQFFNCEVHLFDEAASGQIFRLL